MNFHRQNTNRRIDGKPCILSNTFIRTFFVVLCMINNFPKFGILLGDYCVLLYIKKSNTNQLKSYFLMTQRIQSFFLYVIVYLIQRKTIQTIELPATKEKRDDLFEGLVVRPVQRSLVKENRFF